LSGNRCLVQLTELAFTVDNRESTEAWIVVSCATSVENHVNRLLEALVATIRVENSAFMSALLAEVGDEIYRTWESRFHWLNKGFGIAVSGDKEIQNYMAVVELRNALVHGQDQLTPSQSRDLSKSLALKRKITRVLGVEFEGTHMHLGRAAARLSIEICRTAVVHLDKSVLSFFPDLPV